MHINYSELNLETLHRIFSQDTARLETALLAGASWEELQELRGHVTELQSALHKKIAQSNYNPAGFGRGDAVVPG